MLSLSIWRRAFEDTGRVYIVDGFGSHIGLSIVAAPLSLWGKPVGNNQPHCACILSGIGLSMTKQEYSGTDYCAPHNIPVPADKVR